MTQLRITTPCLLLILAAACGTGETQDADAPAPDAVAPGAALAPNPVAGSANALAAEATGGATLAAAPAATGAEDADALPTLLVFKTPTCGCCSLWVDHMREAGFEVDARDLNDIGPIKMDAGVPPGMSSCHTALVDGYVVEGHIPAEHVKRLLEERPDISGIAVPGMPIGSPGMPGFGARPYQVFSWDHQGDVQVHAEVDPR